MNQDVVESSTDAGRAAEAATAAALSSLRQLRGRLTAVDGAAEERLAITTQALTPLIGQDCLAWVTVDGDNARLSGLNMPVEGLAAEIQQVVASRSREALRTELTQVNEVSGLTHLYCITAPVPTVPEAGVLCLLYTGDRAALPVVMAALEVAAAGLMHAAARQSSATSDYEARVAGGLVDALSRMEASEEPDTAATTLARELAALLECDDVFVGLIDARDGICRLAGESSSSHESGDDESRLLDTALHEAVMRAELICWPLAAQDAKHSLLGHRRVAEKLRSRHLLSTPLRNEDGTPCGALIVAGDERLTTEAQQRFLRAAEPRIAAGLSLMQRTRRDRLERLGGRIGSLLRNRGGRLTLLLVAGLALASCVPLPYRVKATCELQPVTRRFVAAPFEAPLLESSVEPGDMVRQGQLLALLDGRAIRMELAKTTSEREGAAKQEDIHRANGEYGSAEMSRLDAERFGAHEQLLRHRADHLEIRSPIAGIVVSGDWERSEGVPLKTGESLFEIAPLERMVVEVGIPEEDIAHVRVGQSVTVEFDSCAGQTWKATLLRIHPAAELRDQEHVFVGEVELRNRGQALRPGMRGRARIETPARPLFWNLFHKPWNRFTAWIRYVI